MIIFYSIALLFFYCFVGDRLLDIALTDEESINMDMVFEAVDWYRKAILKTREKEVCSHDHILFAIYSQIESIKKI